MNTLDLNPSELSPNSEEAFITFAEAAEKRYLADRKRDSDENYDQDGNYVGTFAPERSYMTSILAFLDEYAIETDVQNISDLPGDSFAKEFEKFKSKVEYIVIRFMLRKGRDKSGASGTPVAFPVSYNDEIGKLLLTIRKIVNQEVEEGRKKDKVFSLLAGLQSEIDRDQTTVDAVFSRAVDLFRLIGEGVEKLDPAIKQLERLKDLFFEGPRKVDRLPIPDRPKAIEDQNANVASPDDLSDDEIPF